ERLFLPVCDVPHTRSVAKWESPTAAALSRPRESDSRARRPPHRRRVFPGCRSAVHSTCWPGLRLAARGLSWHAPASATEALRSPDRMPQVFELIGTERWQSG